MTVERPPDDPLLAPPGPGLWFRDLIHWPRPVHRLYAELYPPGFAAALREGEAAWGSPPTGARLVFLHGFAFLGGQRPTLEAPDAALGARADRAWAEKRWLTDAERWDREVRPAAVSGHRRLLAVDPAAMDDAAAAAYLSTCCRHLTAMATQHHSLTGSALYPVGDFLAEAQEWTGLEVSVLLAALYGASLVSTGDGPELRAAAAAVRADTAAARLLDDSPAGEALERLTSGSSASARAVAAYVDVVGHRLIGGFDLDNPTGIELPDLLVRRLRDCTDDAARPAESPAEQQEAIRDAVPAPHRPAFDQLLADARVGHRLRDERGIYSDVSAGGILRRAALAVGGRLVGEGRLVEAGDLLETSPDELCWLVSGTEGPSADELVARRSERVTRAAQTVPPFLGTPPEAPPPTWPLSPGQQRTARAAALIGAAMFGGFAGAGSDVAPGRIRGTSGSPGVHVGRARVVLDPFELSRVEDGDVVVLVGTTEAFATVAGLVGAIVTDHGGPASHAAIVARECGIPAVVGCGDATARITDGDLVRVDGGLGEVVVMPA